MENATKALLMAAGVLVGILILTILVVLFLSARDVTTSHQDKRKSDAVQQFNTNFAKYLGQDLTIHQVVTIYNFADEKNNKVHKVDIIGKKYTKEDINTEVREYSNGGNGIKKYRIHINSYSDEGYINSISFSVSN